MSKRRDALITRRKQTGWTHKSLAEHIHVSYTTVSCWERGERTPHPSIRPSLAEALAVTLIELDHLLDPSSTADPGSHLVPPWFNLYESMVATTGGISQVETLIVPALLQTTAYAASIERWGIYHLTEEQIATRVAARIGRQDALHRQLAPLQYKCLLAEQIVHSDVGGTEIMIEQLDHIAEVAKRPNVEVRLLASDGRTVVAHGGFQLLFRDGEHRPYMAVTFDVTSSHYEEMSEVVAKFSSTYDYLYMISKPPDESIRIINEHKERLIST
jgi:transcriptional regulator with XRE-family HTH domain